MNSTKTIRQTVPAGPQLATSPMLTRRDTMRAALAANGLATAMLVGTSGSASAASPSPDAATAFIRTTADRMIHIIDENDDLATRRTQLQAVVDGSVDTRQIARFCLGRYWRVARPVERERFVQLFHRVLLDGVTGAISGYRGVRIDLGRAIVQGAATTVQSIVHRPGQADVNADWVVGGTAAGLRIQDVIAEGVSLRLTRRSDYTSYLGRNGGRIEALLAAMQNQLR